MTDYPPDARLRATEVQMRRALGLDGEVSPQTSAPHATHSSNGPHQRRHFVRDGEVPVTVIHRHGAHNTAGELDETKQALLAQTVAHEEAERALADVRNTIHDLETKLGHERLAKDEATQRVTVDKRETGHAIAALQEELAAEHALRARAERERDEATVARQASELLLRQITAPRPVNDAPLPPSLSPVNHAPRRRGRPPKVAREQTAPANSEIVEWWSPGWQEKYR